jgi:hypothetical protein
MQNQSKSGNKTKTENDDDMKSEETRTTTGDSETLAGGGQSTIHIRRAVDATGSSIRPIAKSRFQDRPQLQEVSNQILEGIKVMAILYTNIM